MEPLGKDRAKRLAKLLTTKGRRAENMMLLDSRPLVEEGLAAGLLIEVFHRDDADPALLSAVRDAGVTVTRASAEVLARLVDVKTSPGVAALARLPETRAVPDCDSFEHLRFVVYLDRISDPGNVGTIARSAAAFGCDALLVSEDCADVFSPKSIRASAGALLRIPVYVGEPQAGFDWPRFYRAVVRDGLDARHIQPEERVGLWLGNEAKGPRAVPDGLAVEDVTILMDRDTESLNVTAAAAILAYALMRGGPKTCP